MINTAEQDKPKIPEFKNYEEEAQWWETHEVTDYLHEFEQAKFVKGTKKVTSIYLDGSDKLDDSLHVRFGGKALGEIREIANEKGLGPTTLVRMWTLEKLKEEKTALKTVGRSEGKPTT